MSVISLRPSPALRTKFFTILVLATLIALVGLYLMVWAIASESDTDDPGSIALLVTVIANVIWVVPLLLAIVPYVNSLRYEIQDDEVIVYAGIITKSVKHVPYRTVTNIKVMQGPFDRIFGLGTLNIQTAGMSGQQGAEESLIGLTNFQEVYDRVAEALRAYRGAMAPDQAGQESAPVTADGQTLSAMLSELQAIREVLERQG